MAGSSHGHQRHLVAGAHLSALAGPSRTLRRVADVRGSAVSLAMQAAMGSPHPGADQTGCAGRENLGGEHRQLDRPRPSACGWRAASAQPSGKKGISRPPSEGRGRSRGGLTTKFPVACDGHGRPLSIVITPGHRHDTTQLVRNWSQPWRVSGSHALQDAAGRERAQITSSPTKVTAIRAVGAGYASGRSSTPSPSGATTVRTGLLHQVALWSLTGSSTHGPRWSSAAATGSNSGEAWRRAMRNARVLSCTYRALLVIASIVLWLDS
jgi:hypothetical protein